MDIWNTEYARREAALYDEEAWHYKHLCRFKVDAQEGRSHLLMPNPFSSEHGPGKLSSKKGQLVKKPWFKEQKPVALAELAESAEELHDGKLLKENRIQEGFERAKGQLMRSLGIKVDEDGNSIERVRINASELSQEQLEQVINEAMSDEDIKFVDFER